MRERPALVWGAAGVVGVLLLGLLVWRLWPAKKTVVEEAPSLPPPQIRALADVELIGGDTTEVTVQVDRRNNTGALILRVSGLPNGVTGPGDVKLEPGQDEAQLTLTADPDMSDGGHKVTVTLWSAKDKADSSNLWLTLHKRPMPRLINLKRLVWKVGETRDVDFEVDRQNNVDPLSVEIVDCPAGVKVQPDPLGGGVPGPSGRAPLASFVRVRFVVTEDAAPANDFVTLRLRAGKQLADEATVQYVIEKSCAAAATGNRPSVAAGSERQHAASGDGGPARLRRPDQAAS